MAANDAFTDDTTALEVTNYIVAIAEAFRTTDLFKEDLARISEITEALSYLGDAVELVKNYEKLEEMYTFEDEAEWEPVHSTGDTSDLYAELVNDKTEWGTPSYYTTTEDNYWIK